MFNNLHLYKMAVSGLVHLGSMVGQSYICMEETHTKFDVSHTCHVLIWDKITCDNAYLTRIHRVVCCVGLENSIQETGLFHNKFSRLDYLHSYCVAHNTSCLSNFFIDIFLFFP